MVMMNISPFLSGAVKGTIILVAVLLQKQEK
jgi:ribose/xylose/arabinose/galactoside ABC-type transport system permease subunit